MKKYRVLCDYYGTTGKLFKHGEIASSSDFSDLSGMLRLGKIEEVKEEVAEIISENISEIEEVKPKKATKK